MPLLFACSSAASAQTCVGQPSLSTSHFNVGANMRNVSQGRGFEGRAGFGSSRVFGGATMGTITYDKGTEMRSYVVGVSGGVAKTLGSSGGVCPMVAVEYENGPENIVAGHTALSGLIGLSVGGVARMSETAGLVGFAAGGYQSIRRTNKSYDNPESSSFTEDGFAGSAGLGLLLREQFLFRASVNVLPSLTNNEGSGEAPAYFLLGFSYSPAGRR